MLPPKQGKFSSQIDVKSGKPLGQPVARTEKYNLLSGRFSEPYKHKFRGEKDGEELVHDVELAADLAEDGYTLSPEIMGEMGEKIAGANWSRNLGRSLWNSGLGAVGGFVGSLSQWDVIDTTNLIRGVETDYENSINKWGNSLLEEYGLRTYREGNGMDFSDATWYMQKVEQGGNTLGFFAEGVAEQMLLSAMTAATFGGTSGIQAASAFSKVKGIVSLLKAGKYAKVLKNSTKLASKNAAWGLFKGVQEGQIEAYESFNSTYKDFLSKGYSDKEAREMAAVAASTTFKTGVLPLMFLNGLQYGMMKFNPVTGKTTNILQSKIKNKFLGKSLSAVSNLATEYVEEGWQTFSSKEGEYQAKKRAGLVTLGSNRFSEFFRDGEIYEAALSGLVGGVLFPLGQKLIGRQKRKRLKEKVNSDYDDFVKKSTGARIDYLNKIKKAEEEGDFEKSLSLRSTLSAENAIASIHNDTLKGDGTSYEGYLNYLEKSLEAATTGNTELVKDFNMTAEDFSFIKEKYPEYIQDAKDAKALYEDTTEYFDVAVAPEVTRHRLSHKVLGKDIANLRAKKQEMLASDTMSKVSPEGLEVLDLEITKDSVKQTIDSIESQLLDDSLTIEQYSQLKEVQNKLNAQLGVITRDYNEKKELISPEQAELDSLATAKSDRKKLIKVQELIDSLEATRSTHQEAVDFLSDQNNVNEIKRLSAEKEIADKEATIEQKEKALERVRDGLPEGKVEEVEDEIETAKVREKLAKDKAKTEAEQKLFNAKKQGVNNFLNQGGNAGTDLNQLFEDEIEKINKERDEKLKTTGKKQVEKHLEGIRQSFSEDLEPTQKEIEEEIYQYATSEKVAIETATKEATFKKIKKSGILNIVNSLNSLKETLRQNPTLATKEILEEIEQLENKLKELNIEIADLQGKKYNSGMKANAYLKQSDNENSETGEEIITSVTRPQVNYKGKMVQSAKITVTVNYDSNVDGKTTADIINSKYDGVLTQRARVDVLQGLSKQQYDAELDVLNNTATNKVEEVTAQGDDFQFAPSSVDAAKKVKEFYEVIEKETGVKPTFDSFIETFVEVLGKEKAEEVFETAKDGWSNNNYKQPESFDAVYNKYFSTIATFGNSFYDFVQSSSNDPVENLEEVKKESGDESKTINPDTNKATTVKEVNKRSTSALISTVKHQKGENTYSTDEDGNTVVNYNNELELREDSVLELETTLSNEYNQEGDVLTIEKAPEDTPISIYDEQGKRVGSMPFKEWAKGKDTSSQEYKDKVPLIAVTKDGKKSFFITDTDWYAPLNMSGVRNSPEQLEVIKKAKENVRTLRESALKSENSLEIVVEGRTKGALTYYEKQKPLSEVNPNTIISFVTNTSSVPQGLPKGATIANTKELIPGVVYEFRETSVKNNYIGLIANTPDVPQKNKDIIYAIVKSLFLQKDSPVYSKVREEVKTVTDNKLDIFDREDVENYINMFTEILKGKQTPEMIAHKIHTNNKIPQGQFFMSFQQGNLHFGVKGDLAEGGKTNKIYTIGANTKSETKQIYINKFKDLLNNSKTNQNVSEKGLSSDMKMFEINRDGSVVSKQQTYKEYLKDNLTTNVASYNIGTEANPKYVTYLQSGVLFSEKNKTDKTEDTTPVTPQVNKESQETKTETVKEVIEKAKKVTATLNTKVNTDIIESDLIEGITISQQESIVDYLFNSISALIDNKYKSSVSKDQVLQIVSIEGSNILNNKKKEIETLLSNLESVANKSEEVFSQINSLRESINLIEKVNENYTKLEELALDQVYKFTGITESTLSQSEGSFDKLSLEENGKTTASYRLKRFFAGIKSVDKNQTSISKVLGLPSYVGFDQVYATIETLMSSPSEITSDFEAMMLRLEDNIDSHPFLQQVVDKLKKGSKSMQNEFAYNFTRHASSTKFVMYSKNKDFVANDGSTIKGVGHTVKVYNTNSSEINRVIQESWKNKLINSSLVYEGSKINKNKAKELYKKFKSWNINTVSNETLQDWLSEGFGIDLSLEVIEDIRVKGLRTFNKEGDSIKVPFSKMFIESESSLGIFGLLGNYLDTIQSVENPDFFEDKNYHPFKNISGVLDKVATVAAKYSVFTTTNSFRDGDKNIYGFTATKNATDTVNKLKYDEDFRQQLLDKSYSKNSLTLRLLNDSPAFAEKFAIEHLGITALQQLSSKNAATDITSLATADYETVRAGLFFDKEQGEVSVKTSSSLTFRMARFFFPTMSDKSQMIMLKTLSYEIKPKHLTENALDMTKELKEIIFDQVIQGELSRLVNRSETNIKGYNEGSKLFLNFPGLNDIKLKEEGKTNISFVEAVTIDPIKYNEQYFIDNLLPEALNIISDTIKDMVNDTLSTWKSNKLIEEGSEFINQSYLKSLTGTHAENMRVAAYDYVVNNVIATSEIQKIIAGDTALYFDPKALKDKKLFKNKNMFRPKTDTSYQEMMKNYTGVNLGKRLALLIAPGAKRANSKNKKYKQLFLNDRVSVATNIKTLIELQYGKQDNIDKLLEELDSKKESVREKAKTKIAEKYPKVEPSLYLEGSDAQEYTTAKEHVDTLFEQGRMSDSQYEDIINKLEDQKVNGVNKSNTISDDNLAILLQPIKPVYTGFRNEPSMDVMRMMYIKSSSFPLIPQLTVGLELDKLRKLLEKYEDKGQNVRASYQSANKVGAVTTPISVFDENNNFIENSDEAIEAASLELSYDNLRIQQDVPAKFAKKNKDEVSLGTQIMKLLFGDGVNKLGTVFNYEGVNKTGKQLKEIFDTAHVDLINLKQEEILEELGLDSNFVSKDIKYTIGKIQELLQEEARDRGYPKQTVDSLKVYPVLNSKQEIIDVNFETPLWLSQDSNRFEALLNAVITNRLTKLKLPGMSLVAGSEAGFKLQSTLDDVDISQVVYTKAYEGELKDAEIVDNKVKKTQVLLPSRFRNAKGELIDLTSNKYSYTDKNGIRRLKEEMIEKELLNITSFRIPTSAHFSMSQMEIVGFLPNINGDLLIVPSNITAQKGLDFDVDKETTYKLNTVVKENGVITSYKEEDRDSIIEADTEKGLLDKFFSILLPDDKVNTSSKARFKAEEKLLQNKIIKAYSTVLSSDSTDVQKKITKLLSIDFAKEQANKISSVTSKTNKNFSHLSPSYQREKMNLGAVGKLGIGVYSNYVTFNSLLQQSDSTHTLLDGQGNPLIITLGNLKSTSEIGVNTSIKPSNITESKWKAFSRDISEIFGERQNTATDNEKEQIMGKVNINEHTINVDSVLSLMGFDKDILKEDGSAISIPYALLSQPIIKDYVEAMRMNSSVVNKTNKKSKEALIEELYAKYSTTSEQTIQLAASRVLLTGDKLFDELKNPTNSMQATVLDFFLEMDSIGDKIRSIQSVLGLTSKGLGKSFFNTMNHFNNISTFQKNNEVISNISDLIGEYQSLEDTPKEVIEENRGIILEDTVLFPTTPTGAMVAKTSETGYKLWNNFFPYAEKSIHKSIMDKVDPNLEGEALTKAMMDVFQEMKKYFFSSTKTNLLNGLKPEQQRFRLFKDIDNSDKQSLATYLLNLSSDKQFQNIVKDNALMSNFTFSINPKTISVIKFNSNGIVNFQEDSLYNSLIELYNSDTPLPDFEKGVAYTTKDLAKDLVAYHYSSGGIQEAVQFGKYIPVSMLKHLGMTNYVRNNWNNKTDPDRMTKMLENFTEQYYRNNPGQAAKVDISEIKNDKYFSSKKDITNLESFVLEGVEDSFVGIYNNFAPKDKNKVQLYKKVGKTNTYTRIGTLGTSFMSEYDIRDSNLKSIVQDNVEPTTLINTTVLKPSDNSTVTTNNFDLKSGNIEKILSSISKEVFTNNPQLSAIADLLIKALPENVSIEVVDMVYDGLHDNGKILINQNLLISKDKEKLAKIIIHETIHVVTVPYLKQFVNDKGQIVNVEEFNKLDKKEQNNITSLIRVLNSINKKYPREIATVKSKVEAQSRGKKIPLTSKEVKVFYAGTSIFEILSLALTEPEFQKVLDVKADNKPSFLEKIGDKIYKILENIIGKEIVNNSISSEAIIASINIIKTVENNKEMSKLEKFEKSNQETMLKVNNIVETEVENINYFDKVKQINQNNTDKQFSPASGDNANLKEQINKLFEC